MIQIEHIVSNWLRDLEPTLVYLYRKLVCLRSLVNFRFFRCSLLPHHDSGLCMHSLCGTSNAVTIIKGTAVDYTQKFAGSSGHTVSVVQ